MCTCSSCWSQWQLRLYSWGQNATLCTAHYQRDEVSSFENSVSLETTQESVPPQKETPKQRVQNSYFSHFSHASAREKNQKESAMHMQFILKSILCSVVPYRLIHICMHECIFLSGRGCIADVVKVSSRWLLTLTSYLGPSTLSSTIYCRQY